MYRKIGIAVVIFMIISSACHKRILPNKSTVSERHSETGLASYYADKFDGKPTANGELYNGTKLTAAHRKIPFGTYVLVTNLSNGKSVKVRINDRGPFVAGRIIDLSRAAAKEVDMIGAGIVKVTIVY